MPQTKYYGCNSKWREDQDVSEKPSVWQQVQHQNSEAESYLHRYMYFTNCDGPSPSEKQFVPGRIQMTLVISGSPIFQHSVHQATLQIGFLFLFFNFRGRRRSKKSAVLQLKCMDEVN